MLCLEILGILDPKFLFHHGVLEILYLFFFWLLKWDPRVLDPKFLFCREILGILDPDEVILPWDPVDIGS